MPLQSVKSDSGSAKPARWRLSRTTKRAVSHRPIDDDDVRYAWAAYKKGALAVMGKPFDGADLDAAEFKATFEKAVVANFDAAWTLSAPTKRGVMPVGMVFGVWEPRRPYMVVAGVAWFPWASGRNVVESTVAFFNARRKEIPMVGYAKQAHKRIYEICCQHGVMRRVGTSWVVFPDEQAAIFETRAA